MCFTVWFAIIVIVATALFEFGGVVSMLNAISACAPFTAGFLFHLGDIGFSRRAPHVSRCICLHL